MKTIKTLNQILPIAILSILLTGCNSAKWNEPDSCADPFPNGFVTASGTGANQRLANVDAKDNWEGQVRVIAPGYSIFKRSVDRTWTFGATKNPHTSTVTARPCGKP